MYLWLPLALAGVVLTDDAPASPQAAARAAMQAAIDRQRDAVSAAMAAAMQKQRAAIQDQLAPLTFGALRQPHCQPLAPAEADSLFQEAAQREGVSIDLLRAVAKQESGFLPCAVSPKGAMGVMQLMPATADQLGVIDPFDPRQSIDSGAKLLKQLLTRYGNNVELALSAYNAGAARVDAEGGVPRIAETMQYVHSILSALPH